LGISCGDYTSLSKLQPVAGVVLEVLAEVYIKRCCTVMRRTRLLHTCSCATPRASESSGAPPPRSALRAQRPVKTPLLPRPARAPQEEAPHLRPQSRALCCALAATAVCCRPGAPGRGSGPVSPSLSDTARRCTSSAAGPHPRVQRLQLLLLTVHASRRAAFRRAVDLLQALRNAATGSMATW